MDEDREVVCMAEGRGDASCLLAFVACEYRCEC